MLVEVLQIVFDLMSNWFVQDKIAKEDKLAMIIHLSNIIRVNKKCAYMRTYRVIFLTGPAQKSSKYGTCPTQQ